MIIRTIRVQNFRPIEDATLECDKLTVLVGPNGSGKSCFLRALELFYTPNASYAVDDFYNREVEGRTIIITVTFADLTDQEKQLFGSHIDGDTLVVQKEMSWPVGRASQKYYGSSLRNPDFRAVREATSASEKRNAYVQLLRSGGYSDLAPGLTAAARILEALESWEREHPDRCQRIRDEGQFFGFREVGQAHLERHTHFILVPAVREAAEDASEGRGRVLSELMDLVVRSSLARRDDYQAFQEEIRSRYAELVDPSKVSELKDLANELTRTLSTFAPEASVELSWQEATIPEIKPPNAVVRLVEDGFPAPVDRTGHGLQRAFVMTMLQHLARARAEGEPSGDMAEVTEVVPQEGAIGSGTFLPDLILGVEEPELFQHPNRQRHLARVLLELAHGSIPGVARRTQVLYCTHSPLFVDLNRFQSIRMVRKQPGEAGRPRRTGVRQVEFETLAGTLEAAYAHAPGSFTGEGLRVRADTTMTPWVNEGFFADVVVLVEGDTDRAAILAVAKAKKLHLESMGVSVIPCQGKNNLNKPAVIFSSLGIPVYIVWDNDQGTQDANPAANRALLHLCQAEPEDYPCGVYPTYTCFGPQLEACLKNEIGSECLDGILQEVAHGAGLNVNDARKNAAVMYNVIQEAYVRGGRCSTLEAVVDRVVALLPAGSR